jgi:hypothetical protein
MLNSFHASRLSAGNSSHNLMILISLLTFPALDRPVDETSHLRGLTTPLRLAGGHEDLSGAIAPVVLPHKRWAGLADPQVAKPLAEAVQRGAAAVVLVTTGPTGKAIAPNVSPHRRAIERPVALLAPKDAQPFLAAADQGITATLILDGAGVLPRRVTCG